MTDLRVFCEHSIIDRIDDKFVRCRNCGHTIIKPLNAFVNKTINDFTKENSHYTHNFNRNFSGSGHVQAGSDFPDHSPSTTLS